MAAVSEEEEETRRAKLVLGLRSGGVTDPKVLSAIEQTPRDLFVPQLFQERAWEDSALPIACGQTISQPYIVGLMTHRLDVRPGARILEIGTGTGYQTAVLARLASEVFTMERVKPLLDEAFERLLGMGHRNIHFKFGDGTLGWPEHAPFDRILIAAGAPEIPSALLLSQLKDEGIAILPVGPKDEQTLLEVRRHGDRLKSTELCACRFVQLIGEGGWKAE
jgi:protein-L-isoaspartate(D-aspartate) O-methyltransferase